MSRKPNQITFNGETMSVKEWAERIGISPVTLRYRLDAGWPLDKALTSVQFVYRAKKDNPDERFDAYRLEAQQMQAELKRMVRLFTRNTGREAAELSRQATAMITERLRIPDNVMTGGVVEETPVKRPDQSLSFAQDIG